MIGTTLSRMHMSTTFTIAHLLASRMSTTFTIPQLLVTPAEPRDLDD